MFAATFFVSLLAVATAIPTNGNGVGNGVGNNVCGNGNTVQCCDHATADKLIQGSLIGDLDLSSLLGQCNDISVNVIGAVVPIKNICHNQAVCCNTQQNGLVNLGCTPIEL
ncbi:hypothetical protein V2A60_008299 [Cordyceps javanica]|uniref:Hydrophobin n=1 Tax=Cordyceps javanica TaxID=43265 RepID=A0A545UMD4_9HYPO|nr:fungal hydrophobin domain-containing protein [Cordyceps javanica]TQW02068.1 fungal hydrophobin domain-containing protein [Cordyceps javanica]